MLGANLYYYSANYGLGYQVKPTLIITYPLPNPVFPRDYTTVDRQTDAVVDLSLRADYRITPKFSIFAMGNNLANRHYQRYLNYRSQGINVIGGASYAF